MNYISKILISSFSILILWFLIFSTFFVNDSKKLEALAFNKIEIWRYNLIKNNGNQFSLNEINEDNIIWNENILEQITKTSKLFIKDWIYSKTNS